jgi:hypothetical protein
MSRSKAKEFTTAQMCKMVGQNIITSGEMLTRLLNLGWDLDHATKIVGSCGADISKQEAKDAAAKAKADKAAADKAKKDKAAADKAAAKAAKGSGKAS